MVPTDELRVRLRRLVDESIPEGKTDRDTRFLDADIDDLLIEADNILLAASEGWLLKAVKIGNELGQLAETQAGDERYKRIALSDAREYCLAMAKAYEQKGAKAAGEGSRLLGFRAPCPQPGDPQ